MAGGYMNSFGFIFISLTFSESFLSTKGMGLCDFADKFPCDDNGGSPCFKSPGCKMLDNTNTGEGTHLTTKQFSDNRSTPDIVSTNEQLIDHLTSENITTDQATTDQLISTTLITCPPNMVYANCSTCQGTCMDPKGCISNCTKPEMCVCPNGYLLKGDGCVPDEECGCFVADVGVIPEEASYILSGCSRRCSCSRGQLDCDDIYRCSPNAVCEVRNDVQQCYCNVGYEGDGVNCTSLPSDCLDVYHTISTKSGVYKIRPTSWQGEPFDVYCEMTDGGGWTVFQRRVDGTQDFHLYWSDYKVGFGTPDHELWLGNDKLHSLTNQGNNHLRIDFVNKVGNPYYATYSSFGISDESDKYRLSVGGYSGNSGNRMIIDNNGQAFSTRDSDNDGSRLNCATYPTWACNGSYGPVNGAWWYGNNCGYIALNSLYNSPSFFWYYLPGGDCFIQFTEMKVRRV